MVVRRTVRTAGMLSQMLQVMPYRPLDADADTAITYDGGDALPA